MKVYSTRALVIAFFAVNACAQFRAQAVSDPPAESKLSWRHPIALALVDDGRWLLVANQRSGMISIVDARASQVVGESPIGRRLSDLVASADGKYAVALYDEINEVILLRRTDSKLEVLERVKVGPSPVGVQLLPGSHQCVVSLSWSRQLAVLDFTKIVSGEKGPPEIATIRVPFPPGRLQWLQDKNRLVVADAYSGGLAIVDVPSRRVEAVRTLPSHNQRGMALTPDGSKLIIAHQSLNHLATTSQDDIHWGNLLTNNLRVLPTAAVTNGQADWLHGSSLIPFGDPALFGGGQGGGDPSGVAAAKDGTVVVTLGGVDQIAIAAKLDAPFHRLKVGARPTAVAISPDGQRAYVANTFDDSISVIDLHTERIAETISLGPTPSLTAIDRGERLFYNARLSHLGWFSCHSCHPDGHTPNQLVDNLSDGSFGTPKRILTLRGIADTAPYAWNGSLATLEEQIMKSFETTMASRGVNEQNVADLAAYLRTIPPPPRLPPADAEAVKRGEQIFRHHDCQACHSPPSYTSHKSYDVGLADEAGNKAFNPPSLRGVVHGGPFFHDGRAATLEEVFSRYRHQLKNDLPPAELADLLAWLRSL